MFASRLPRQRCLACTRSFSSTSQLAWKSNKNALAEEHANLPPYPFGAALWYRQSNKGLYGGSRVQFGNNISERTETKSRRQWHPNVNYKNLWSRALKKKIRVRVSTRVLRTIDKVGGLDEYLLGDKTARIQELGMRGWKLRCMVMGTEAVQRRFNEQRRALGLPEVDYAALQASTIESPPEELAAPVDAEEPLEFEVDEEDLLRAEQEEYAATSEEDAQVYERSREELFREDAEAARDQQQRR